MTHTASLMLLSSSYVCTKPKEYLGYCGNELRDFLGKGSRVLFVPFAYPDYAKYTEQVVTTDPTDPKLTEILDSRLKLRNGLLD